MRRRPRRAQTRSPRRSPGAVGVTADVSTEAGNVALIDAAERALGPIDLFFANAGVGIGTDLDDTDEATWEHVVRRQRPRPPLGGEAPAARLARARRGLLLLDGVGRRPARPDRLGAVHASRKRAAVAFAEWLAITYGDHGIKVSCLCPQGVNTAMLHAGDDAVAAPATS